MLVLSGSLSIFGVIILFTFFIKTKLSPLFGLFLGMFIPLVVFIISFWIPAIVENIPASYMLIIMNILMYLGFQGKLDFFED